MSTKNKKDVMVIDDSLLICKEIKKALGDEVFICEAHNGEEAMERIAQYQPDLILLDVCLLYTSCAFLYSGPYASWRGAV